MSISSESSDYKRIVNYLKKLEARISRIETHLDLKPEKEAEEYEPESLIPADVGEKVDSLEFQIGEYWFAKVGIVVLAIGIAFLLTLPYKNLPPILPGIFGYLIAGGIFLLSYYWRQTFVFISRYLLGGGLVLLYFTTLRLHFFSEQQTVTNRSLEVALLLAVVAVCLWVSVRRKSVYLSGISLTMGYATAIISNQAHLLFIIITVLAALAVYLSTKFQWRNLPIFAIILTYFTHFAWFISNPFLGNRIELVSSPHINIFFVLLYALIFAAGNLFRGKDIPEDNTLIAATFLNCAGAYGLFLLLTVTKFQSALAFSHLLAFLLFLSLSIVFWIREQSRYSTFFYAMLGYTALSVAIIAQFEEPDSLIWLSWQSLLVISTAIWFRSKFIVVANFAIYVIIFLAYLVLAGTVSALSLSFGVVALLSARIMNWQKDHLELKTELMRNAYLIAAFFMFPYALYHLVPGKYISLSWVAVTIFYYVMSRILNNKKYRWMALLTLVLTVFRVFIVDMTGVEPVLRVVSFLVLGVVLLVISLIYTRTRAKSAANENR